MSEDVRGLFEAAGVSQARFGRLICADKTTVNRWVMGIAPISGSARLLLHILAHTSLTIENLEAIAADEAPVS